MAFSAALTCAVVGSAVVALFGGTTLGLAGPGLAMGFALADVARDYGAAPLALAGAMCGLFQLIVGVLGVGRFARLVPLSVVHGFVLGLGALLVIQSLPDALGLAAPADVDEAARAVIVRQLDNLRRFPLVRDRLASGEIELHGWFYDVRQAELFEWDEAKGAFTVMEGRGANEVRSEPPPLR